jgi:hypothetical protein
MMVVAAASLLCIALLAIGKAHVKRPRTYITTLLYYISIGFSSAGLSYVVGVLFFFSNYTIHRRHSQHAHTHPYEYTHANPTLRSIFEDCAGKSSRLTKSPQAHRCLTKLLAHFGLIDHGGASAPAPPSLLFPQAMGADATTWASY